MPEFKSLFVALGRLAAYSLLLGLFLSAHASNLTRPLDLTVHQQAAFPSGGNMDSGVDEIGLASSKASKNHLVDYSESAHADHFSADAVSALEETSNPLSNSHSLSNAIPGLDVAGPLSFAEHNLANLDEQVSVILSSLSAAARLEKDAAPADPAREKQPQAPKTEPALVLMGGAMCFMGLVIGNLHKNSYRNI